MDLNLLVLAVFSCVSMFLAFKLGYQFGVRDTLEQVEEWMDDEREEEQI